MNTLETTAYSQDSNKRNTYLGNLRTE